MSRWGNKIKWLTNSTKGRSKRSPSVCIELHSNLYYVNGMTPFVNLGSALEYAHKRLPKVNSVAIFIRPGVVYMHERKPSPKYTQVSEKLAPKDAWDLFVGHVGMLS